MAKTKARAKVEAKPPAPPAPDPGYTVDVTEVVRRIDDETRKTLGDRMRRARVAAGFPTVASAAAALGMNEVQLGDWERGKKQPTLHSLIELSRVYGRDVVAVILLAPLD